MPGFLMSKCCKQGQVQLLFLLSIKKNNTHLKFNRYKIHPECTFPLQYILYQYILCIWYTYIEF